MVTLFVLVGEVDLHLEVVLGDGVFDELQDVELVVLALLEVLAGGLVLLLVLAEEEVLLLLEQTLEVEVLDLALATLDVVLEPDAVVGLEDGVVARLGDFLVDRDALEVEVVQELGQREVEIFLVHEQQVALSAGPPLLEHLQDFFDQRRADLAFESLATDHHFAELVEDDHVQVGQVLAVELDDLGNADSEDFLVPLVWLGLRSKVENSLRTLSIELKQKELYKRFKDKHPPET